MSITSAGRLFRELVRRTATTQASSMGKFNVRAPVHVVGAVNAYSALIAEKEGAKAVYLSGSGVATASHGLPDLGITNLNDVVEDAKRITSVTSLPLLVDIDTGFGSAFGIMRTVRELQRAGVAAVHMEDQVAAKRCGHRPGKELVSSEEMVDRIASAVEGRTDPDFVIMARSDALAVEGLDATLKRIEAYIDAGADMIFPEAFTQLEEYAALGDLIASKAESREDGGRDLCYLANITEFAKTPLYTPQELGLAGAAMVLHPLSAHRAMAKAAATVYREILTKGHVQDTLDLMQTRDELYEYLDYHKYEGFLDTLFEQGKEK